MLTDRLTDRQTDRHYDYNTPLCRGVKTYSLPVRFGALKFLGYSTKYAILPVKPEDSSLAAKTYSLELHV